MTERMSVAQRARGRSDTLARIAAAESEILRKIRLGVTPLVACASCGIPSSTFLRWRMALENGDDSLVPFFLKVEAALAEAEVELVELLRNPPCDATGKSDYGRIKATTFVLERSRGARWSPKMQIEHRQDALAAARELMLQLREHMSPGAFAELAEAIPRLASGEARIVDAIDADVAIGLPVEG